MKSDKWSTEEQVLFLKRTGELLERGYPLSEAIESLLYHFPQKRKDAILCCLAELKEGFPFHRILSQLQFNTNLIGFVYFAEQHGGLATAFQDGSELLLKREHDLQKVKKLLSYPLILMSVTAFMFVFVHNVLLPRFTSLFQSMSIQTNMFTRFISLVGNILPFILAIFLLIVLGGLLYYVKWFRRASPIRQKLHLMKIPLVNSFLRLLYTHYFSVQLSYLLSSGLSIFEALLLFENNQEQPFYRQIGKRIKGKLATGEKLETILKQLTFFEGELVHIVKHGQENGKLDQELYFYSRHCLHLLEYKTEKAMKVIQPIIYLFLGVLIVSMYLAVLLPMFHLLEGI
ncbi:type II secretion system F family protein [Cytobacillus spongiae]|jgi:competence protein ComGB|uniref:competence type IV pilus assembly protein ComGB n=1 Tax=Cytobacillus spongiae TaxID=2901381 RepID=UPI001F419D1F|nr:competence type IV pilus assembly protein ComGB [Cytobacillus spongiae]UII54836.1 type II secretion system F family protein [Cytobacillus spongiae]